MENADILTNASAALERYRSEERLLETEVTVMQARLELVREFISALSGKPRVRRPRSISVVNSQPPPAAVSLTNEETAA
jgi:hypothetical protein